MFTYTVDYKPFQGAYTNKRVIEADSAFEAELKLLKESPHACCISIKQSFTGNNVIYVDFKLKKRVAA